jgi:hypothetical protein
MTLVEKSVVFQLIIQTMMDYHIKYILLHRVINIKNGFVIIYIYIYLLKFILAIISYLK